MQGFTLFFPALASFLLHVDAGPLTIRGNNTNNQPICSGARSPAGKNVSMQTYCVDMIGAACATVVVFPNNTMSGNPGNCGKACSCTKSQCPAVFPACQDASCMGDPDQGCSQQPGVQFGGCNCTGAASEGLEQSEEQLEDEPTFQNGFDTPQKPPCPSSILCSDPKCDGINLGGGTGTCNAVALSLCRCSVDKTACPSSVLCSDPKCDGANGEFTCTHGALNTCPCS